MKKGLSVRKFLSVLLLGLTMAFSGFFVACNDESDTFSFQTDKTDNVLVYQSDFDFDQYFSQTFIKKTTPSGEEFLIPLTQEMLASPIDTSSVGEKNVKIHYNSHEFDFNYTVKYKVEFLVDGQVVDTQLVLTKEEIEHPVSPTKDGFTFEYWQEIANQLDSNVQINAVFSENAYAPELTTLSAVYGDTLDGLTLPSNKFGAWQFVENLNQVVGDAGENIKEVKFVLKNGEILESDTVKIEVSKKTVQFAVGLMEFEYDGNKKSLDYELTNADKSVVNVLSIYNRNAVNVGVYDFEFIIEDPNYQGEYSGQFEIVKKHVKILVDDKTITYGQPINNLTFNVFDLNNNAISQALLDELEVQINPFINPDVGVYDIDIVEKTYENFVVQVVKGKLSVNKATYEVDVVVNQDQAVFGNALSQVELLSTVQGVGEWEWKENQTLILTPNTFTATVIFTPNDSKNYNSIEKEITFEVLKKTVEIVVIQNQFTFDKGEKTIDFVVNGVLDNDFTVAGNLSKINAGYYDVNLDIVSEKYNAKTLKTQLVINKANISDFATAQSLLNQITYNKETANKLAHVELLSGYYWIDPSQELLIGENVYDVQFIPEDTDNYIIDTGKLILTVNKAQGVINLSMAESYTFNEQKEYDFGASVNNLEQKLQFTYLYNGQTVQGLKDAGTYVITITCAESDHYLSASVTVEIEILAVENDDQIITSLDATYLDSLEQFAKYLPNSIYGVWTWEEGNNALVGNAGKQTHNAIFMPYNPTNYKQRVVAVEFNVEKASVSAPTAKTYTFDNQEKVFITETENYSVENGKAINAGKYNVVLSLKENKNYKWENGNSEDITITFEILKATNVWETEPSIIKEWTFGQEVAPTSLGKALFGDVVVKYYQGETELQAMPTNAGEYKAVFEVLGNANYTGLKTEITFTIEKASVEVPTVKTYTFDKNEKIFVSETDYYTVENGKGTEAKTYNVILTLKNKDNYKWLNGNSEDITLTFEIKQATNKWENEPSLSKDEWTYMEEKATVNLGKALFGEVEVKYYQGQTELSQMPENAGEYKAVFEVLGNANYTGLKTEITFTIEKIRIAPPQNQRVIYNGEQLFADIQDTKLYTVVENNGGKEVGVYDVKVRLVDSVNYCWETTDSQDVIVKLYIQINDGNIWLVEPNIKGWIFGQEATVNEYDSLFGDVVVKYYQGETELQAMPKNAGEYKAVFIVEATDNYTGLEKEITFTIEKASVEVPTVKTYTFDNQEKVFITETENYSVENGKATNAGKYNVVLSLKENKNYKWENGNSEDITITFEILKATNVWETEPSIIKEWTFGQEVAPTSLGKALFGDVVVKYYQGETELQAMPENAGEYKAVFEVLGNANYTGLKTEITFTIEKASVEVPTVNTYTFDANEKIFVSETDYYTVENGKGTEAKTYNIILTLKDKDNYKWLNGNSEDITLTFEIKQATNKWEAEPSLSKDEWAYNEEKATVQLGKALFGDVVVKYYQGETELQAMPTNAGVYKAVFEVLGNANYTGLKTEITFTIEKASVDVPQAPNSKEYIGKWQTADVIESELYKVENVGGEIVGNYDVVYTLKDSANYKWADGKDGAQRTYVFTITKSNNGWEQSPSMIKEWTFGQEVAPTSLGKALFGEVYVIYYDANENVLSEMPTNAGKYYVEFKVNGSDNYLGLSEKVAFEIMPYQLEFEILENNNVYYENLITLADVNNFVKLNREVDGEYTLEIAKGKIITDGKINAIVKFIPTSSNYATAQIDNLSISVYEVAYIGVNYYGSIESALSKAVKNDKVWVKAGISVTIEEDCTIPSGVTLNVPYENDVMNSDGKATLSTTSTDHSNAYLTNLNVLTVITINEGITLTNNGTLKVAGELSGGAGGLPYAGHTAGDCAKIVMKTDAKIHNFGTINLFGLIVEENDNDGKGNGSQVIVDGGNLYIPFVVRDFRGGTYMRQLYSNTSATAFNEFELRNITSLVKVQNSANVYGYANLYAGSMHNATTIALVSTKENAVIHFKDNSGSLTAKYNIVGGYQEQEQDNIKDAWADGIMNIEIFGDATADPMSMTIQLVYKITTATVFFPLTWRMRISLYNGEYTMGYKYKLMPGHVFTVGAGARVSISTLTVYTQEGFATIEQPFNVPKTHYINKATDVVDAKCIVENGGTLKILTAVGGDITIDEGGQILYSATKSVWTCSRCKSEYYVETSKCGKDFLCGILGKISKSEIEVPVLTSVTSYEGIAYAVEDYDQAELVFDLSINGVKQ